MAWRGLVGATSRAVPTAAQETVEPARAVVRDLFGPPATRGFAVRYWDGTVETPVGGPPRFTLVLRRPGALRRALLPPSELALAEGYLRDDFDIEGALEPATGLAESVFARLRSPLTVARVAYRLLRLPAEDLPADADQAFPRRPQLSGALHSPQRDVTAVRYHYDVGNDFYALWLDRRMIYSCAYFATGAEDLDAAQEAKLDYICRKLRLQPGEHLLDIGCGWGGLVIYAAAQFGVQALGITLSEQQAALARQRVAAAGLSDRCRIEVCDYRSLRQEAGFDKIVSVGMVEHVGRSQLPAYFAQAYRLLRPGGLFLNHGIVLAAPAPGQSPLDRALDLVVWRSGQFSDQHVFPDGELVTPGETVRLGEAAGFETRDLESLREHYALTLRHWTRRLEQRHDDAAALVGEPTYRVWRLYTAAFAREFARGRLGIVQTLFSKPDRDGSCRLPLTRADLYREAPSPRVSRGD